MINDCRLYLITPAHIPDLDGFQNTLRAALSGGDVACVQLRLKNKDETSVADDLVLKTAEAFLEVLGEFNVDLIINDRADLAKQVGAQGVHLGQSDTPLIEARALLGDEASIGITCHDSRHLALTAGEEGADYVAFGAFFPTQTKAVHHNPEPELLTWWQEVTTVPCVAIGGITAVNCGKLVCAGADFLAVSAAVWNHEGGPGQGVEVINKAIASA